MNAQQKRSLGAVQSVLMLGKRFTLLTHRCGSKGMQDKIQIPSWIDYHREGPAIKVISQQSGIDRFALKDLAMKCALAESPKQHEV